MKDFILIIALFFCVSKYFGQVSPTPSNNIAPRNIELLFATPNLDPEHFDSFKQFLSGLNGLTFSAYCEDQKCFAVYLNESILTRDRLQLAVIEFDKNLNFFYKKGDFTLLENLCSDEEKMYSK